MCSGGGGLEVQQHWWQYALCAGMTEPVYSIHKSVNLKCLYSECYYVLCNRKYSTLYVDKFHISCNLYFRAFIEEKLGAKYVETRTVEFSKSFEEASPSTPIFFILSPGVNPLKVSICLCWIVWKCNCIWLEVKLKQKCYKTLTQENHQTLYLQQWIF